MKVRELAIAGVFEIVPQRFEDQRGYFFEGFVKSKFLAKTGIDFDVAQMNVSSSNLGTIRGIHLSQSTKGQSKYVQCLEGTILDVVVDVDPQSKTFMNSISIQLDSTLGNALFVPHGLGHSFQVLTSRAIVVYACSSEYDPQNEIAINPFDPDLAIEWPVAPAIVSDKDRDAMSLKEFLL